MKYEIKDNNLDEKLKWYEDVVTNKVKSAILHIAQKGNHLPEDGKIIVIINDVMNVQFLFENVSPALESEFLNALKLYRI